MATRWEITKAVRGSDLPAPSRLIMLTLADVAEVGTAEIPAKFTPSLRVLSDETGLNKSTVKRHLTLLDEAGWIERTRPDAKAQWEGERTRYRLTLPRGVEPPGVGAEETLGAQKAQGGRAESQGVGAEEDRGRRTARHLETDLSDQSQIKSDPLSSAAPTTAVAIPDRIDVEHICRHLADRIEANGSNRPTITKKWREAARLLIDKDGRTVEQITRAIDWCQNDTFWRSNILSMPKLREKYDQLRLAAQRSNHTNGQDIDWNAAMERAMAREGIKA